ncbi:MAG: hypothetical protein IJ529_03530 [Alphaproteobacteria bacterium]|nr:hypothetical protein [Alphaproteobacteria bacterium]
MEIYLMTALVFVYIITVMTADDLMVRRIWTAAFIVASILTAASLACMRIYHQEVLLAADSWNWYYPLYLCGSAAVVLGMLNLWIYRKALWHLIHPQTEKKETDIK